MPLKENNVSFHIISFKRTDHIQIERLWSSYHAHCLVVKLGPVEPQSQLFQPKLNSHIVPKMRPKSNAVIVDPVLAYVLPGRGLVGVKQVAS